MYASSIMALDRFVKSRNLFPRQFPNFCTGAGEVFPPYWMQIWLVSGKWNLPGFRNLCQLNRRRLVDEVEPVQRGKVRVSVSLRDHPA